MALPVVPLKVESPAERAEKSLRDEPAINSQKKKCKYGDRRGRTALWVSTREQTAPRSPAVEVLLHFLALAGAVFLRSAGADQRGLGAVGAKQHLIVGLLVPL